MSRSLDTQYSGSNMRSTPQGSYKIQYHSNGPDADPIEIDFTPPWRRISLISGLEECLGVKMPTDLDSPETRKLLVSP